MLNACIANMPSNCVYHAEDGWCCSYKCFTTFKCWWYKYSEIIWCHRTQKFLAFSKSSCQATGVAGCIHFHVSLQMSFSKSCCCEIKTCNRFLDLDCSAQYKKWNLTLNQSLPTKQLHKWHWISCMNFCIFAISSCIEKFHSLNRLFSFASM